MRVRDTITKIREFNAAMELPFAGQLGIRACLAQGPTVDFQFAVEHLSTFLAYCGVAEAAAKGTREAARRKVFLYGAIRELFKGDELAALAEQLSEIRERLGPIVDSIREQGSLLPAQAQASTLRTIESQLDALSERLERDIPRDAFMRALSGSLPAGRFITS